MTTPSQSPRRLSPSFIDRSVFWIVRILFAVLLAVAANQSAVAYTLASPADTTQGATKLILADESTLIGTVVQQDSASITFKTVGGVLLTIPKNQVKSIEQLSGQVTGGQYFHPDPNYTRLLYAPTARPLKSGQGYFSVQQIFFPVLAVGIADVVTLGGGMSIFPGASNQLVYLAPKITPIHTDKLDLAAGLLYINTTEGGADGIGIYYTVGTYGTASSSITAGLGWGFHGSDVADKPVLLIGAEIRTSKYLKLITENWFLPDSDIDLVSFGFRFFGERLAADLGFIYPAGSEISGFPFFPWVSFSYNFGSSQ